MKTEKYSAEDGSFRCFGFPNTFIGKQGAVDLLSEIQGIEIVYFTKRFGAELICEFTLRGVKFELTEPFGDNSYYDITCASSNTKELQEIYEHVSLAKLPVKGQRVRFIRYIVISIILLIGLALYKYYPKTS